MNVNLTNANYFSVLILTNNMFFQNEFSKTSWRSVKKEPGFVHCLCPVRRHLHIYLQISYEAFGWRHYCVVIAYQQGTVTK